MNLAEKRIEKGFTQEQAAQAAGISRAAYTNIENHKRMPSVPVAKKIASILDFDWTQFFDEKSIDSQMHGNVSDAV